MRIVDVRNFYHLETMLHFDLKLTRFFSISHLVGLHLRIKWANITVKTHNNRLVKIEKIPRDFSEKDGYFSIRHAIAQPLRFTHLPIVSIVDIVMAIFCNQSSFIVVADLGFCSS